MFAVHIQIVKTQRQVPAGQTFSHTNLVVTDSAGQMQTMKLTGAEVPPWTATVEQLPDGGAQFTVQDIDVLGRAIGPTVTQAI